MQCIFYRAKNAEQDRQSETQNFDRKISVLKQQVKSYEDQLLAKENEL